jgi:hypothetical protein
LFCFKNEIDIMVKLGKGCFKNVSELKRSLFGGKNEADGTAE